MPVRLVSEPVTITVREDTTRLTFPETFVDLGVVRRGDKREHTFAFENTGSEYIQIDMVSSCDCTTVYWPEGEVIDPGEKGEIRFVFDSTNKEKSEIVDIDIILRNTDSKGNPIFYILQYGFELVE